MRSVEEIKLEKEKQESHMIYLQDKLQTLKEMAEETRKKICELELELIKAEVNSTKD